MKILRVLLRYLVLAAVLAALLAVVAISPVVQTWVAQMALDHGTAVRGSVGWVVARFGTVDVTDVKLKIGDTALTLPLLEADLPITTGVLARRLRIRRLVAKGWTLNVGQSPGPEGTPGSVGPAPAARGASGAAAAAAARNALRAFLGALNRWKLPCDLSLDGVDLEGDVVIAAAAGRAPVRVRVVVKGGGMTAGREGDFAIDATSDLLDTEPTTTNLAGHGHLIVAMKTPRTFGRVEVRADLSAIGGPFPNQVALAADATAVPGAEGETYSLDVSRGDRRVAAVVARYSAAAGRFAGTWQLDVRESDLAPYLPAWALPRFAATGDGQWDADIAFAAVHARGRLKTALSRLDTMAPDLKGLGAVDFDADFEAFQSGKTLRVEHLSGSLTGEGPGATVRSLQAFEIDEETGEVKPAKPADDWMDVAIRGFPLRRSAGFMGGFALSGGVAAGDFVVRMEKGGFAVRSKAPVTVTDAAVVRGGRTVGRKLDLALSLLADYGPQGWQVEAAPLIVGSGGCELAKLQIKVSRPAGRDQPVKLGGTWSADLQARTFREAVPDWGGLGGRSASGDFSVTLGTTPEVDGKLVVVGRDEHHSITASVHAAVDDGGRISFKAPVQIAFGPVRSDLSVEGTVISDGAKPYVYLKLNGKEADLGQLRLLAGAAAAAGGWPLAGLAETRTPAGARVPFWGDWAGRVTFAFDRLRAGDLALDDVGGAFGVDDHSIHIEEGRGTLAGHRFANVEGSLAFDAAGGIPYRLKAAVTLDPVEAAGYFPAADPDASPLVEGRFTMAGTLEGEGTNLQDLINRTQVKVRLASTAGIVRLFRTDVDEALPPDTESSTGDALGRIGSAVGGFFGIKDAGGSGRKTVSPAIQAALDVVNATSEIGFDQCAVTAVRGTDGTIRLADLAMTAGEVHITGSGQITYEPGRAWRARPLHVELQLGARGETAKLLAAAGLLSAAKDSLGYTLLSQPLVLGGTLEHIDNRPWHELLVKAAERNPAGAKNAAETHR